MKQIGPVLCGRCQHYARLSSPPAIEECRATFVTKGDHIRTWREYPDPGVKNAGRDCTDFKPRRRFWPLPF